MRWPSRSALYGLMQMEVVVVTEHDRVDSCQNGLKKAWQYRQYPMRS